MAKKSKSKFKQNQQKGNKWMFYMGLVFALGAAGLLLLGVMESSLAIVIGGMGVVFIGVSSSKLL